MTQKIKKIIAREYIIFLGFILFAVIISRIIYQSVEIIALIYFLYLLVRTLVWAIKTLINKD